MADQTIDKIQIEVDATSYKASQALESLEKRLDSLQKAMNGIDVSKLQNTQKAIDSVGKSSGTAPKIDTSGFGKAEKDISNSVAKIQQALAGLQSYANAAMNGDSSSFTSFERRVTSIQSSIDVLKEKFAQLGNTNIPTDAFTKLDSQIENTRSHLDALEAKLQKGTDSGGAVLSNEEYIKLQTEIQEAGTKLDGLIAKQHELVNQGQAFTDVFGPYKESLDQLEAQLGQTAQTVSNTVSAMNEGASPTVDTSGLEDATSAANACRVSLLGLFDSAVSKALSGLWSGIKKIASAIKDAHSKSDGFFGKGMMRILKYGFGIRSIYVLFRRLRKAVTESFKELQNSGAFFEETRANVESLKQSLTVLKYQFGAAFEPIFNAVAPALKTLVDNLISVMNTISAFTAKLMGRSTYSKAVINAAAFADNTGKAAKAQKELNKQLQGFDELNNLTTNNSNPNSGSGGSSDDIPGAVYVEEQVDNVLGDFWKDLADKINQGDWKGVGQAISDKLSSAMESIDWESIYKKASNFGTGLASFLNGLINPRLFGNLGKTLAGALNTAFAFLNSFGTTFDWKNFGESIATGINNFFTTFNFRQVGETLHTWIAGALDALITFFEKTDFEQIGKAIAEFIGGLDIPDLAKKLAKLALKILEALADAIKGLWNNSSVTGKLAMALIGIFGFLKLTGFLGTLGSLISAAIGGGTITANAAGATLKLTGLKKIAGLAIAIGGALVPEFSLGENLLEDSIYDALGATALYGGLRLLGFTPKIALAIAVAKFTWDFGTELGKSLMAALYDALGDSEMAKYYREFSWASFFPDIIDAAKTGNLSKGAKMMFTGPLDAITSGRPVHSWDPNIRSIGGTMNSIIGKMTPQEKEAVKIYSDILGHLRGTDSVAGKLLRGTTDAESLKEFAKVYKGIMNNMSGSKDKSWAGAMLNGEISPNELSQLFKTFNDVKEAVRETNLGMTNLRNETNGLVSSTKSFGDEAATSANKFKTGFSGFAQNVISTFSDAYTKGTKTWNGIGRWAATKATDASKGFDSFSGEVSGKFDDAYTQSTNKWSGISTWANDVTTKTTTGMSLLPSNVAKTFGDAYTDGTNKWNELGTWATTQGDTVDNAFNNFPTKTETQFGNAYTNGTTKWNGIGKWASDTFSKVSETSSRKLGEVASQFETNFNNGTNKAQSRVSVFSSFLNSLNLVKKTGVEADESAFQRVKNRFEGFKTSLNQNKNVTIAVEGRGFDTLGSKITSLVGQLRNLKNMSGGITLGYNTGINNFRYFASGGVVGGATPAIVGEAGPEAILPLTDGTLGKLADMIVGDMAVPQMPTTNSSITSGYGAIGSSSSEIARQNQLLQEQNQLLRQIAGKELTISSRDVYDATRQEANNYYNRTGNSPFLF